ncbi:MAG: hypothetical protein K2L34_03630 [Muribaculaceae bacterium]|nr:hypothetical protein [Muribaculaceae bacterium]
MRKIRPYALLLAVMLAASPVCGAAGVATWETVKTEIVDAKSVIKEPDIEILTAPSCIIVNCNKQVDIKVFTILGRVVSSETLPPGSSRLTVGAHGVYIVKVGELTCKIAL